MVKKYVALIISVFLIFMTIISITAIPASAMAPKGELDLASINFRNYYEYRTNGKKVQKCSFDSFRLDKGSKKRYILITFVSEDAEEKEYYNAFGENGMYYEKSDITNLMYPSGLVVCDADNMYTGYVFDTVRVDELNEIPQETFRDASEWTDDDFMSVEKACSLDPYLAEALVNKSENIGVVPKEEPPTEEPTQPTTGATEPTTAEPTEPAPSLQMRIPSKGISLKAGETMKLNASNGTVKSWSSSDKKIATVKNGKVTALKKGSAIITATLKNGEKLTAKVNVTSNPKLNKIEKKLKVKDKFTLKVKGKAGTTTFKSNKPKIATVTKKGVVKAKKKGTAKITVTTNGGVRLKCTVKVK